MSCTVRTCGTLRARDINTEPPLYGAAAWNSEGSNCRLRPGEGAVESHAAAWGDETDKRRALPGNDDLEKSCANMLSSNLLESD